MAGVKVIFDVTEFRRIQKLIKDGSRISKRTADKIGASTLRQYKRFIRKGISPIRGKGRFPGYKPSYEAAIRSGRFPGKRLKPINLKLTGQFLRSLRSTSKKRGKNFRAIVGYFNRKAAVKEQGHRVGANQQRKRPTIPQGREQLNVDIQQKLIQILLKDLNKNLTRQFRR